MTEWTYDIIINADIIARNVPERYLMVLVKALLEAYHSEPNLAVIVSRVTSVSEEDTEEMSG